MKMLAIRIIILFWVLASHIFCYSQPLDTSECVTERKAAFKCFEKDLRVERFGKDNFGEFSLIYASCNDSLYIIRSYGHSGNNEGVELEIGKTYRMKLVGNYMEQQDYNDDIFPFVYMFWNYKNIVRKDNCDVIFFSPNLCGTRYIKLQNCKKQDCCGEGTDSEIQLCSAQDYTKHVLNYISKHDYIESLGRKNTYVISDSILSFQINSEWFPETEVAEYVQQNEDETSKLWHYLQKKKKKKGNVHLFFSNVQGDRFWVSVIPLPKTRRISNYNSVLYYFGKEFVFMFRIENGRIVIEDHVKKDLM